MQRNANSGVRHGDQEMVSLLLGRYRHGARIGKFDTILYQVEQNLLNPVLIPKNFR